MYFSKTMRSVGLVTALALFAGLSTTANAQSLNRTYSVTVTNITKATAFTPLIGATHSRAAAFFELGEEASEPLADVAESGSVAALEGVLNGSPAVAATATSDGLLFAGDSVTFEVKAFARTRLFSIAAMILPTNDSFVALNSVSLPRKKGRTNTYHAKAYDAGSETNDEQCASIPGPMCQGEGLSPNDDGEGFVHIANGIHGGADLDAALYTWDGPVAKIEITRVH